MSGSYLRSRPVISLFHILSLSRRPSQWLAPGVTALTRMVSSTSNPMVKRAPEPQGESEPESEKEVDILEMKAKARPLRYKRHEVMEMVI